jgi:O-antigen/teichoic acid export membrane protein
MTARNSTRSFLQATLLVAALGGVVVGLLVGMNETVGKWHAGAFDPHDLPYFAAVAGALLIVVAGSVARTTRNGIPFMSLVAGFVILGVAFNGLTGDFAGRAADVFLWASGCSFGAAMGLLLARWMMRRAPEH